MLPSKPRGGTADKTILIIETESEIEIRIEISIYTTIKIMMTIIIVAPPAARSEKQQISSRCILGDRARS